MRQQPAGTCNRSVGRRRSTWSQAIGECYREYIAERLRRYEKALAELHRGPAAVMWRATVLWDLQLFFEAHELLEQAWMVATGEEKLVLQAMIRAAGVFIKLEYGYREAALKMAGRALPVLAAHRDDPCPLLRSRAPARRPHQSDTSPAAATWLNRQNSCMFIKFVKFIKQ